MHRLCLPALAVAALHGAAQAHEVKLGSLTVAHPYVALNTGCAAPDKLQAYVMMVVNEGTQPDRLLGAQLASGAVATLTRPGQGAAASDGVVVPAGGRATLAAPDLALEFPRPTTLPPEGGMLTGTLRFERAGTMPVQFMVEAAPRTADGRPAPCHAQPAAATASADRPAAAHRH